MLLSQLYVSAPGTRPETRRVQSLPAILSQLNLAWGEGGTFAGQAPLLVRKCFRSTSALLQLKP
eukprot:937786-Prymnesium_polylepis.1